MMIRKSLFEARGYKYPWSAELVSMNRVNFGVPYVDVWFPRNAEALSALTQDEGIRWDRFAWPHRSEMVIRSF